MMKTLNSVFTLILSSVSVLGLSQMSYSATADQTPPQMQVMPAGSIPSQTAPSQYFSGQAPRLDMSVGVREAPSRLSMASVSFEPSARSNWHTHPAGQMLIVTAGQGYVQSEGGEKITINPSDMVWTPAGVKHWHGATEKNAMTHLAIQESVDGKNVNWLEPVTDMQYAQSKD